MGKLEKYTSYKNSGVEWLGEIPEHWELLPFKSLLKKNGLIRGPFGSALQTSFFVETGYKVYEQKNAIYNDLTLGKSYINKSKYNELKRFEIFSNDFLMSCSGTIGKLTKVPEVFEQGIINQAMLIIRTKNEHILDDFFEYLFSSEYILNTILDNSLGSAMKNLVGMSIFKNIKIPLPKKEEQTKIASFLDKKTAQIDEVISQKQKLIELLKERKQIVINDAVTKGLDKNVEFVDSGVEWIGEIPKHWEIEKVKYIFKDSSIKNYGEEIPLAATQLYGVVPKDTLDYRTVEANVSDLNTFKLVKENNFVISLRSFEGGIEYSAYKGIISPAYTVMEALQDIAFKYFKYLFKSNIFIQALNIYKTGIREGQNISFAKFKDDFLPLPSKNEQMEIAEYIEIQTSKIDKTIELQQNYILKLKEYKSSLIDSVVTGKVKVFCD